MQLLRLSLNESFQGAEQVLVLSLKQENAARRFGFSLSAMSPDEPAVNEADFRAFCADVVRFEPNRWREHENLTRLAPPLWPVLGVAAEQLLRAMALVMLHAFEAAEKENLPPEEWLFRQKGKPLTLGGPGRQHRTSFVLDPDTVTDEHLPQLLSLWREGLLMECILNPRPAPGEKVRAFYLTPPYNRVLIPKHVSLTQGDKKAAGVFWDWVLAQMNSAPQVRVGETLPAVENGNPLDAQTVG